MRVILGLLIWSLAEISALVVMGRWIGLLAVLAIVLGSGVAGVMLLRRQGVRLAAAMRGRGGLQGMGEAGLVAFGAVLLIMPGLLTCFGERRKLRHDGFPVVFSAGIDTGEGCACHQVRFVSHYSSFPN